MFILVNSNNLKKKNKLLKQHITATYKNHNIILQKFKKTNNPEHIPDQSSFSLAVLSRDSDIDQFPAACHPF